MIRNIYDKFLFELYPSEYLAPINKISLKKFKENKLHKVSTSYTPKIQNQPYNTPNKSVITCSRMAWMMLTLRSSIEKTNNLFYNFTSLKAKLHIIPIYMRSI